MVIAIWNTKDRASYLAWVKWTAVVDWLQWAPAQQAASVCYVLFPLFSSLAAASVLRYFAPISVSLLYGHNPVSCYTLVLLLWAIRFS